MKGTCKSQRHAACCLLFGAALTSVPMAPALGQQPSGSGAANPASASAGSWVATGSLNFARTGHTATLLADGKALVVGGWDDTYGYVPGAELYDPTTGIWTLTGNTKCTRADVRTATLLFDGKVLIAGGGCEELYNPVTRTFTLTGGMNEWRIYHTATRLADGRVLVAGGIMDNWDGTPIGSAEIYDPATGRWTLTGALGEARFAHTATLLRDGRVLVLGYSSAELYDPNVGIWKSAGALALPRSWHQATLLASGKVLVTDGEGPGPFSVRDSELFDPATGTSTVTSGLNVARAIATVTLLQSGEVLVAGGVLIYSTPTSSNALAPVASAAKYDSTSAQWQLVGALITPRYAHTATLLQDGRVLVAGGSLVTGDNKDPPLASAELYGNFPSGTIGPGYTGAWFDPAQNGHGLLVEVLPDSKFLAAWFTFNPAGTQQSWFLGVGTYSGDTATVSAVYQPTGGRWIPNFDPSHIANNPWGTLKFTFTDCNHGKVEFASTAGYGAGSMNLTRLTQPAGLTCP